MCNSVKKTLSVLLSLLMVLSVFCGLTLPAGAAVPDDSKLLGRFFSTSDFRYDAVSGTNAVSKVSGSDPVYDPGTGFTTLSDSGYLQIDKQDLYAGVNENTGLSFAVTYYSAKDEPHEHLISSGVSAYDGSTVARHFYIAGTYLGAGTQYRSLFLEWIGPGGDGQKTIRCYADGLTFQANTVYDIIVTFSVSEGVVYTVNGKRYAALYMDSSYADQKENIRAFLNDVANYQYHYIGRSRWGQDGNFAGGVRDMRLYRDNLTSDPMLGRFFSTGNVWYDAVTEDPSGLMSAGGTEPVYNASTGFTTLNANNYLQVSNPGLFAGVTPETGLTLAFTYRPTQDLHYVQLLSFGKETYEANSQEDHFYIGATFHDTYRDASPGNPLVFEWRYGEVSKVITWPQGLAFSAGTTYGVTISISAAEGVVYTVNGVRYNTRYYAGTKADVNTFLNVVPGYKYGYIGRSRWTGDTPFGGDMKDLRLYKTSAQPSRLLGRFFSTSNVWYDAVTNDGSGLVWKAGDYPSYNGSSGYTYFGNPAYVAIRERPIFSSVSADTGVTFAFVYQPTKDKQYNQLLSFGYNEYNTGDARKRHIYVGATYHSTLGGNVPLYMDWMDGSENAHIRAYPSGLTFSNNAVYDVVITISAATGVTYIVNGVKYDTVYYGSSFENERASIVLFLNDIQYYQKNYIGRSRWTGDESFTGNIRDLRLYAGVPTQTVFLSAPDADVEGTTVTAAAYGSPMPAVTIPQRTAYTFEGYYDAVSGGTKYYNGDGTSARSWDKTAAATLYARWTPTNYTITYDTDGGDAIAQKTYNIESADSLPGAVKTGHTFDCWTATAGAGAWTAGNTYNKNTSLNGKYGDATLKANWTINSSDLRIDPKGGVWNGTGDLTTINRDYGEVYTPGNPTPPEGSHFTGWSLVPASLDEPNGTWENGSYTFGPEKDVLDVLEATYAAHTYTGSPVWGDWTQDGGAWTCTATFTCDGCANTTAPTVTVTPAVTGPTCTEDGFTVYTATVTMDGTTYTNPTTKTVEGDPATDHHYTGAPTWGAWTQDGGAWICAATFKCDDCDNTITPEVSVTSETTGATCTDDGFTVYTAAVTYNGTTYTNPTTKTVAGDPATGHTYEEPAASDWTWTKSGDTYTATVAVSCEKGDDTQTLTATVELTDSEAAGHLTDGHKTFTATATVGAQTFTAEKTDVIAAEGHSLVRHPAAPSTRCDEYGTVEYWSCEGCALLFSDENAGHAIEDISDHTYGDHSFTAQDTDEAYFNTAATCTARATYFKSCAYCGLKGDETFETGGFDYDNHSTAERRTENAKAPGYTFKGYTGDEYCVACDHETRHGQDIAKLDIDANADVAAAKAVSAEAEADPAKYDADDVAALNAKLSELEDALAIDDNDAAVLAIIEELADIVESMDAIVYFTVTFTVDGAEAKSETVRAGGNATPPDAPEYINDGANHRHFTGWTDGWLSVSADITVNAIYETQIHAWVDGSVTKEANCHETGTQAQSCVCGAANVKTLPENAENHDGGVGTRRENETAGNCCTAPTWDEVEYCLGCGETLTSTPVMGTIDANAHNWGGWTVITPAGCETAGEEERVCANDPSHKESRPIDATGHSFGAWTVTTPATCEEDGVETRTCAACGETETRAIPASNAAHQWGAWNVTKEPTCAEAGEQKRTCAVCGKTETKAVEKLAHDWGEWIDDEGSTVTCTSGGTQHRECANCGATETRDIPGGFGHVIENPNLRGEGYCKYCGEFICNRCADMTQYEDLDIIGIFFRIVHFFIHFAHMISYHS